MHTEYETDSVRWRSALAKYLPGFFSHARDAWEGLAGGWGLTDITLDSRAVKPGSVFLAVPGTQRDGRDFIGAALAQGAACVLYEAQDQDGLQTYFSACPLNKTNKAGGVQSSSIVWPIPDLHRQLSAVAGCFYGHPSHALDVVGVTGTNGKTSCVHFLYQLLQAQGIASVSLGTLGCIGLDPLEGRQSTRLGSSVAGLTTPDPVSVQRVLARCVQQGKQVVCMEVSSHALAQGRVDAVRFAVGVLTHVSRDHLDYHGDMETYWAAKRRLFTDLKPAAWVINGQDERGQALLKMGQDQQWSRPCWVYMHDTAFQGNSGAGGIDWKGVARHMHRLSVLTLQRVAQLPTGLRLTLSCVSPFTCDTKKNTMQAKHLELEVPLWGGAVQAMNVLAVFGTAGALGQVGQCITPSSLTWHALSEQAAWTRWQPVPGRWQWLRQSGVVAVVDYAHTPDALAQTLATLRPHCPGRLWCVFGCGGDRDIGKRPQMARAAARGADYLVLTQDNPRHESPDTILAHLLSGLASHAEAGERVPLYWVEEDRSAAIHFALSYAAQGDVVLIAGKGHETTQTVGDTVLPFSDVDQVKQYFDRVAVPALPDTHTGFSIDTRTLLPGNVFFALTGTRSDGHRFLSDAKEKGGCAAVVSHAALQTKTAIFPQSTAFTFIPVPDTRRALGLLGAVHRRCFRLPVVGLTGSCGKSTTKALIGAILGQVGQVCMTQGNYNNTLGVPLTLSRLSARHDYAVIEMGTSQPGEIRCLSQWVMPTVALITNAHAAHLSGLHSIAGVAQEKGDILLGLLPGEGTLVLPLESPFFQQWAARAAARKLHVVAFSLQSTPPAHRGREGREGREDSIPVIYATPLPTASSQPDTRIAPASHTAFYLHFPSGEREAVYLALPGAHNKANALAAAAVGVVLGVPATVIAAGLGSVMPVPGRLCMKMGRRGETVFDDTYNANPASVTAALAVLVQYAHSHGKRSICVLGDMTELGTHAERYHANMGRALYEKGVDQLLVIGQWGPALVAGFCACQPSLVQANSAMAFTRQSDLVAALRMQVGEETVVLVKGSRSAKMEKIVQALCDDEEIDT